MGPRDLHLRLGGEFPLVSFVGARTIDEFLLESRRQAVDDYVLTNHLVVRCGLRFYVALVVEPGFFIEIGREFFRDLSFYVVLCNEPITWLIAVFYDASCQRKWMARGPHNGQSFYGRVALSQFRQLVLATTHNALWWSSP